MKIKTCYECNKQFEYDYKSKSSYNSKFCISCFSRIRNQTVKKKLIAYKGGKCERCGYDKCMAAIDFHHRTPSNKKFGISVSLNAMSFSKLLIEVDKCILLCSNCHREEHYVACKNTYTPRPIVFPKNLIKATKQELELMITEHPMTAIANHYKVSDKTIAKWCKEYGIKTASRGYWRKT